MLIFDGTGREEVVVITPRESFFHFVWVCVMFGIFFGTVYAETTSS